MGRRKMFSRKTIKKEEIRRDKKKEKEKEKDQGPMCYECKKLGHFRLDYPLLKKALKKKMKKALFGVWSDDEVSSSSDEEKTMNVANLCLMGLEDEVLCPEP